MSPTSAVLECDDEDLEDCQRLKEELEEEALRELEEKLEQLRMRRRLAHKIGGNTILGLCGPPRALTRPPQPCRSLPVTPPSILGPSFHGTTFASPQVTMAQAPRIYNSRHPPAMTPMRTSVSLGVVRQNRPIQITSYSGSTPATQPPSSYQQNSNLQRVNVSTKTSTLQSTTGAGLTLQSGQVLSMNQFQPLLFDANSGLLLMPTTTQVSQMRAATTTTNALGSQIMTIPNMIMSNSRPQGSPIISSVYSQRGSVQPNRTPSPRIPAPIQTMTVGNTTVRSIPPLSNQSAPPLKTYTTPKIIGSTSLNPISSVLPTNKPQRPALIPAPKPPPLRAPAIAAQMRAALPASRPPPLLTKGGPTPGTQAQAGMRQVGGVTIRPIMSKPATIPPSSTPTQMVETTSTINGQSDKDPNNNKTFPSLVVNVKPCLQDRPTKTQINDARIELDARVKALLVYSTSKFTEWLMQKGLLRLEHRCDIHMTTDNEPIPYKLGMYSDAAKQPFSGGYVWIAECCPDKQISVFQGSIFESAIYQPGTIVKLIYHWSCQTSAPNVLQWVKVGQTKSVTSYYLKNFYTLLRSCCVATLHEFCPIMGGNQKYVEVGIITLGSAVNQSSNQKSVKIEILGVFDPTSKVIRMKVLNPHNFAANSIHNRVSQILWPLNHWVDKNSCILIDSSIEKHLLTDMGFKTVLQCKSGGKPENQTKGSPPTNVNVMNYLKHVVPKMFQNTLCVLSKSLIQQFLDELSWRELWGQTSASSFDTMINHLVTMTKWEMDESLIARLNKISLNPFGEWSYSKAQPTGIDALPDSIRNTDMPELTLQQPYNRGSNGHSNINHNSPPNPNKRRNFGNPGPPVLSPQTFSSPNNGAVKRKALETERFELRQYLNSKPKTINLFSFYFNECPNSELPRYLLNEFPPNLKCPLCSKTFLSNLEIMRHVYSHVTSMGRPISQSNILCEYCLKEFTNSAALSAHINDVHKLNHCVYPCVICQEKFHNQNVLTLHMWETHCEADMPHKCETCDYRSSRQTDVVDHFHKVHNGSDSVLCPLCLKVLSCKSFTCLKAIVVHIQSHTIRKGKKCPQCSLVFIHDTEYRVHLQDGAHKDNSAPSGREIIPLTFAHSDILMPYPPVINRSRFAPPPPLKKAKYTNSSTGYSPSSPMKRPALKPSPSFLAGLMDADTVSGNLNFHDFVFYLPPDSDEGEVYACVECSQNPGSPDHFPGWMNCSKCEFNTSCQPNMATHNRDVHPVGVPTQNLSCVRVHKIRDMDAPLRCSCGYKSSRADGIMLHLQKCGKTHAFPVPDDESDEDREMPELEAEEEGTIRRSSNEAPPLILEGLGLQRT